MSTEGVDDDEEIILYILNSEQVNEETKEMYISLLKTVLHDLSKVMDANCRDDLLNRHLVDESAENICEYFSMSLEDLKDETFAVNLPGSSSYTYLDMIQKKNQVSLKSLELSNYENRIATVKAGKASYIVAGDIYNLPVEFDSSRLYLLEPEQGIAVENCLICRQGYQTTSIYKTLLSTLREIITG